MPDQWKHSIKANNKSAYLPPLDFIPVGQLSQYAEIPNDIARKYVDTRKIPSVKIGGRRYVRRRYIPDAKRMYQEFLEKRGNREATTLKEITVKPKKKPKLNIPVLGWSHSPLSYHKYEKRKSG